MNEHPKVRAEQNITVVCLRGHQQQYTSKACITEDGFHDEVESMKCPTCGAMPDYATDGLNKLPFDRTPQERELKPEDY